MSEREPRTGAAKVIGTATLSAIAAGVIGATLLVGPALGQPGDGSTVFTNEFHYDNTGTDAGEFIEVAGPAGTDLSQYTIVLYNGGNGTVYDTDALTGTITDQQNGYGTSALTYPANGIQNGPPDGIALVGPNGLIQFLSYEGTFTGVGGPADGVTSTDVGVSETGAEPAGLSLQLTGTGETFGDFRFVGPLDDSPGQPNVGQTFAEPVVEAPEVPGEDRIPEIQGEQHRSPMEGETVTNVPGVITAFRDFGFFMQDTVSDGNVDTSQGI